MADIVVTGASGFVAKHVILQLLAAGHSVRGTLRNMKKASALNALFDELSDGRARTHLNLFPADLLSDDGWAEVMSGADAVIHTAMVVFAVEPKERDQILRPAIDGTQRVLSFAKRCGVDRVISTSSIAAVGYGHGNPRGDMHLSEEDWTDVEGLAGAWTYSEAKTRAEQAAWQMAKEQNIELTTICPAMILGPAVDDDNSASLEIVRMALSGKVPMMPAGGISAVDVRDVAQMHVNALSDRSSVGGRYLSTGNYLTFADVAKILADNYPDRKVPSRTSPAWLLKFVGRFSRSVGQIVADLETRRIYDKMRGEQLLGRPFRSPEEAILAAAESLIDRDLV